MRQTLQIVAGWNAREIEKGEKVVHSDFACPTPYLELALSASYLVTHWLHLLLTLFQFGFICLTCCPLLALPALHLISNWLYLPHTLFRLGFIGFISCHRLASSASHLVSVWLYLSHMLSRIGFTCLAPYLELALFASHLVSLGFIGLISCHRLALSASNLFSGWLFLPHILSRIEFLCPLSGFFLALSVS